MRSMPMTVELDDADGHNLHHDRGRPHAPDTRVGLGHSNDPLRPEFGASAKEDGASAQDTFQCAQTEP